jgi:NAD(P)-dependent dehydrogenase (short-subunit alcohol dehydrogenase family)
VDLENKVVFITGSSVGIGRATAYEFAKEGSRLILTYRTSKKEAEEAVQKCRELGSPKVLLLSLDIQENESIENAVVEVKKSFGKIDILINNAGALVWEPFEKNSFEEIEVQTRTNLEGTIKMTRECLSLVQRMIINIASQVGTIPYADAVVYAATKWGIRGFTKSLALANKKLEIYSVNPGATSTQMSGFTGVDPARVGEIIVRLAKGEYNLLSGDDVNVFEMV